MREIFLRSEHPKNLHVEGLCAEINLLADQSVRIYRTCVRYSENRTAVFSTTSKDIHLSFGVLSENGRVHLAQLLHGELAEDISEILLFAHDPLKEKEKAMYVTVIKMEEREVVYNFSRAESK